MVSQCILNDITIPALGEAIQFFNGITTKYASANIIQAQRDYFGAHTYQRLDDDSGKSYHTNWNKPITTKQQITTIMESTKPKKSFSKKL